MFSILIEGSGFLWPHTYIYLNINISKNVNIFTNFPSYTLLFTFFYTYLFSSCFCYSLVAFALCGCRCWLLNQSSQRLWFIYGQSLFTISVCMCVNLTHKIKYKHTPLQLQMYICLYICTYVCVCIYEFI